MNELVRLSLATCIIGCVAVLLPTAFAGSSFYCYKCPASQLQPLSECNMTTDERSCGDSSGTCFAATIELMNGTFIGVKDCFRGDYCNSSSVCTNVTGGLPGISFKRCEASCCSQSSCNKYLPASWPPSPTVSATSSVSVNATQTPATKAKDTDPTAAGINVNAVYYLPICLLAVIQIMS